MIAYVHLNVTLEDLNLICSTHTAFSSFSDLMNAKGGYRPSIDCRIPDLLVLADCYDEAMEQWDDSRRALRYGL